MLRRAEESRSQANKTANMAAKHFYRQGFLLLLFNFISTAALEKRFSDFKRCADEECSMLLCRGKAVKDFSGPDCRFLSFKKSETIYVYYKLSGKRADLWAGSVGSNFGYFPKDLLAVNHLYTEKELEIKAEDTDFVCFDTGYDKFDSYDIDLLLGLSVEENDGENNGTTGEDTESIEEETKPSVEEVTEIETQTEHVDKLEELHEDQSASLPKLEINTSTDSSSLKDEGSNTATVPVTESEEVRQQNLTESPVQIMPESSETTDESDVETAPVTVSEGVQIPQLKPTLGTTFDAVVTEEKITTKVTPYEEEDSEDLQDHSEERKEEVPLLSFLEEPTDTLEMDSSKEQEKLPPAQKKEPNATEEKNLWTSLGDAVFSVVTGGETTGEDVSSDEEDEDETEEPAAEPEKSFEKTETEPLLPDNQKHPEDMEPPPLDPHQSNSVEQEINETKNNPEKLSIDGNVGDQEVSEHKDEMVQGDEALNSPSEPEPHETKESSLSEEPVLEDDLVSTPDDDKSDDETPEDEDELEDPEISKTDDNIQEKTVVEEQLLDSVPDESRTTSEQELGITESEKVPDQSFELKQSSDSDVTVDQHLITDEKPDQINDNIVTDVESNTSQTLVSVEEEIHEQPHAEEDEDEKVAETEEEINEEKEELLEDENALLSAQSDDVIAEKPTEETTQLAESAEEPEYSENILRLSLLREHFTEEKMDHIQKLLGLKNLFKVEAMFADLDTELKATRLSHTDATQNVESTLENILEASENTILDEIEKMLDSREKKQDEEHHADTSSLDEETEMLDDFQELAFSLRQKYSTSSDSAPLATPVTPLESTHDQPPSNVAEETPPIVAEKFDNVPETDRVDPEEESTKIKEEQVVWTKENMIPEKDAEDSDKNKDQSSLTVSDEEEKVPQPTPEYLLDVDVEAGVEHYPSGSVDSMETVTEKPEEELGLFTTGTVYMCCIFSVIKNKTVEWTTVMISLLPEEWKPGETLFGCPWQAVIVTALIGVLTFTIFFWRTVLAVKKSKYLVDEKKFKDKIQTLIKDKSDALAKISELQKQTEQLKENQKQSKETVSCTMKRMQALESKVVKADKMNEQMAEEKNKFLKLLEEERAISLQNDSRLEKLERANEKLQVSRKKIQEALAKSTILLDEAKIREDARNAQHKCFQKEFAALKEENKTLKTSIKAWEEKHKELNEKIKVYQKSHKELEDSVVLKDHNVEVLSELLADLDACDLQKGETSVLANGEVAPADKKTAIKNRIKQMMDVTRVQTTLTVIEEERDRFMAKLLNEEKSRKELEEKHQELEHSIGALKSEKSQIENQYKILQQKNEIMVEMYQQKENALQQRLTKEELERRSKENLLSEVGGKAVEAEEQVKLLRQRINEMEEQMKKTEEVYKEQIKEQENKTHSNWVNARNAERALSQEKVESSKLREKLAILTSQLNERRAPLFRPNSGQPPGPRQGDSYGPSPVSGGAPSPPIMIEGPRRPPSAPVGRRIDPYAPRPPSDPHGMYPENKHVPGMDMMGPRSSSPANPDGSGPGSFMASPIRDSPGSMVQRPPPGPGPHDPFLPPGPNVRLPPPGPYGHPRPGPYPLPPGPLPPNVPPLHGPPLPANGHPGMPLPGPMGGEFGPRPANGHLFQPRLGPDSRGPPPPHFRPSLPPNFGPMPPPLGVRRPLGPRPLIPHDMRFPGPRDHISPLMDLPPGVPPPGGLPLPAHPGQGLPSNPQNLAGPQSGPAPDTHLKQEAPQDSVRPGMV
ncbi:transport and Golgi organization protein 1 homolog isoform X2 [Xiphophorus hellerii]|uniref:transport and Golgi organization protein 1 homolog isoform X2 n=1 Tax=Xiphophorus hellerii TaxID=8084 RepID=UPI0013B37D99|nr:transport and Golgi organization protein 1 homolog isoform X2 [Xiphophorus hellerii]